MSTNRFQIRKTSAMGLKRVSKLIEKINVLHDSLLSIDEEISSIEKDLLLNYIRQLYEQVLEIGTEDQKVQMPALSKQVIDLPKQEAVVEKITPPVVQKNEVAEEIVEPVQQAVKVIEDPAVEEDLISEVESNATNGSPAHDLSMEGINEELVGMFEIKEAKELSEKLSSMPIKDLSTAMGINDRFLTVNELFGGDNAAFKACIDDLNKLNSYDEAKSYLLSNIAQKYEWSSAEKLKKAAGFISLVQRRFR